VARFAVPVTKRFITTTSPLYHWGRRCYCTPRIMRSTIPAVTAVTC
jgi:hypothetical protein